MMKHDIALKVAEALVEHLRPACVRIEIAGSIRRLKPEVKDIEIVCVPDLSPVARAPLEFGKPVPQLYKTQLEKSVDEMRKAGDIDLMANGDRYKKMRLKYAGIVCDLFIVIPPAEWGVLAVIRTGPSDFSHWCVTSQKFGGALPVGYFVKHGVVWIESEIVKRDVPDDQGKALKLLTDTNHLSMPEEVDFLKFLQLGWIEPKDRVARWKR
jgi:DNA polymerase/3'-5' exonuclease PolX